MTNDRPRCDWMGHKMKGCPRTDTVEVVFHQKGSLRYTMNLCEQHEAEFLSKFPDHSVSNSNNQAHGNTAPE